MTAAATLGTAVADSAMILAAAGIDDARREARLLVALSADLDPAMVLGYPERPLDESARLRLNRLVARRAAREPLSRLRGRREFWSLDFALSPATLDPRPDSESLVTAALKWLPERLKSYRLLDFGTGTGCLLLAMLSERPNAAGIGIDLSFDAVRVARRNAASLGFGGRAAFVVGSWGSTIAGSFDGIVANPPYIPGADIAGLAPEVAAFGPRLALDGGPDGLTAYRLLAPAVARLLRTDGVAAFEVGEGQACAVAELLRASGLCVHGFEKDLAGIDRVVVAFRVR